MRAQTLVQALAEAVHAKQAPIQHALADQRKKKNYVEFWNVIPIKDPFRLVLSEMRDRLFHTREVLHQCLMQPTMCAGLPAQGTVFCCPVSGDVHYMLLYIVVENSLVLHALKFRLLGGAAHSLRASLATPQGEEF